LQSAASLVHPGAKFSILPSSHARVGIGDLADRFVAIADSIALVAGLINRLVDMGGKLRRAIL